MDETENNLPFQKRKQPIPKELYTENGTLDTEKYIEYMNKNVPPQLKENILPVVHSPYVIGKRSWLLFMFLILAVIIQTTVTILITHSSSGYNYHKKIVESDSIINLPEVKIGNGIQHPRLSSIGTIKDEDLQFVVRTYPGILTEEECNSLIRLAETIGVKRSGVQTTQNTSDRHSLDAIISIVQCDGVSDFYNRNIEGCNSLRKIYDYMVTISGYPVSHMEPVSIVKYTEGQFFNAHEDRFPINSTEMKLLGSQRSISMLLYLNNVEDGGETQFIDINLRIIPETGKSLVWRNTPSSRHESSVVKKGVKWVVVMFVHDKELPPSFL